MSQKPSDNWKYFRKTMIRNAKGEERHLRYDACGNLIQITDFNGGVTEIEYNEMNKPVCVTDPDGCCTRMKYDVMWNLTVAAQVGHVEPIDGEIRTREECADSGAQEDRSEKSVDLQEPVESLFSEYVIGFSPVFVRNGL